MSEKNSTFLLQMITPEQIIYGQPVRKLVVGTLEGEITVLPHHTPLVAAIKPGEAKVVEFQNGKERERVMAVSEGVIEVRDNIAKLLVQKAERVEELEQEKIEQAKRAAEQLIEKAKKAGADKREFATLEAGLEREIARLKVLEKYRRKRII
ncbi:MAG: ATP synthase F1 subunit epsilon [Candidatus Moranbacteria bacterium]|nr:ATP synthase F1 subunit epsilon [Candidatus Moranbacteria bacterium]